MADLLSAFQTASPLRISMYGLRYHRRQFRLAPTVGIGCRLFETARPRLQRSSTPDASFLGGLDG